MSRSAVLVGTACCVMLAGCTARGSVSSPTAPAPSSSSNSPAPAPSTPVSPSVPSAPASSSVAASPSPASTPSLAATTSPPASPSAARVPVLGQGRPITTGYGSVRPGTINNGGDPTGIVTDVKWQSWGGAKVIGTGTGYYAPAGEPASKSTAQQSTVVAFNLGNCDGQYMYQAIEWYFPQHGGSFNPNVYLDICSWTYQNGTG